MEFESLMKDQPVVYSSLAINDCINARKFFQSLLLMNSFAMLKLCYCIEQNKRYWNIEIINSNEKLFYHFKYNILIAAF